MKNSLITASVILITAMVTPSFASDGSNRDMYDSLRLSQQMLSNGENRAAFEAGQQSITDFQKIYNSRYATTNEFHANSPSKSKYTG